MRYLSISVAALAAYAALSPAAWSETLNDAFAKAYASNPSLISARAGLRATDENVPQARAGMLPNVSLDASVGANHTTVNGPTPNTNREPRQVGLGVTQVLYDGGRTWNSIDSAVSGVDAARSRLVSTEQEVLLSTVTAYSDVRRDQQFVSLAKNNVSVITEQLRAARDRFAVGEVTRTDVSQAEARLAESRAALATREGQLARAQQAYYRVVGSAPGELAEPPAAPDLPRSMAEAVQEALDNHPEVKAARFDEEQARENIATAQGALLPTISLNGNVSYGDDIGSDRATSRAEVLLQASVPLYQGGAAYSGVRQARALRSQRMALIHETSRAVREAAENAWTGLVTAQATIRAAREQVRANRIAFEGVQEEAKLGSRTTLDVLDAEQELLEARTNVVAAERDEYVAAYNLLSALGRLTVAHLGIQVEGYSPEQNYIEVNAKRFGFKTDELTEWKNTIAP